MGSSDREGRLYALSATVGANVTVVDQLDQLVASQDVVTLVIDLVGGGTADEYLFDQTDGPPVDLTVVGKTAQFVAPASFAGTVLRFDLSATLGGATSPPVSISITVRSQDWWTFDPSIIAWIPKPSPAPIV